MPFLLKSKSISVGLVISAVILAVFQYAPPSAKSPLKPPTERWRPSLAWVSSIDEATPIAWEYIQNQSGTEDEKIVRGVDTFVRDRFVHGFSYTPARENWILAALGGAPPYGLSVPIGADSILKHRHAMCSQQSIVFMELLRRFGIEYASVRFAWPNSDPSSQGHFAVAAKVDGYWRYYDSNLEAAASPLISDVVKGKGLSEAYPGNPWWVGKMKYAAEHGGIRITDRNRLPGPRGLLLQRVTGAVSTATPFILLVLAVLMWTGLGIFVPRKVDDSRL